MPQVPYSPVPTVDPQINATPSVRPSISPDAFGASEAAASQQFGASLGQADNQIFSRALALEELDQQASVDNALNPVYDAISNRMLEFRSKAGLEAKNDHPAFIKDINSIIDKGAESLTSDYAKQIYLKNTRHMRQVTVESAGAHAGAEFKNYLIGTEQARVDNARTLASLHPTDDKSYRDAMHAIDTTMLDKYKGWGAEQRDSYIQEQKSALAYERARALNETDFKKAREFLNSAVKNGEISGVRAGQIADQIRNRENTVVSRVESAKVLDGSGAYFGAGIISPARAREAISSIEGSGNYNPAHPPVTHKVNGVTITERALGRYGIMQSNLRPWLKEAGMPSMTDQEFLNDHDAQDKLFEFKFGQLMEKHGSANKAAMAWFTGSPDPDPNRSDNGSTAAQYLQKFNRALAKSASRGEIDAIADKHASSLEMKDNPEFPFILRARMASLHAEDRRIEAENEFNNKHTIEVALGPDANGKLPTSIEAISDPTVHAAWEALPDYLKERYNKVFARNAKEDYAPTTENQAQFRSWLGKLTDPMTPPEIKSAAMDKDFMAMDLPMAQRQQLVRLRAKLFKNQVANPKLQHAMSVLGPQLYNAGVTRKQDEEGFYQFQGTLHQILDQQLEATGTFPKDQEIIDIGTRLLRETVTAPGIFFDTKGPQFRTEVPEASAEKLKQAFIKVKGVEPTDAQLQQAYNVMIYNQLYGKKKEPVK